MRSFSLAIVGLILGATGLASQSAPQEQVRPTFRAGTDLVAMTVVVHDRAGRRVEGLSPADFELFDAGERRPIVQFSAEPAAASVAVLLDISGSMSVGAKLAAARDAMGHLVSWLDVDKDEVAIFTFDSGLREERPFGPVTPDVAKELAPLKGFGSTSLYDAIAQVAQRAVARPRARRVVVVLTDGVDTSSTHSASEVSQLVSAIDVPVYVIAVVTPLDDPGDARRPPGGEAAESARPIETVANRTGGLFFLASAPAHASLAARQIAAELHSWYQIGFEPSRQSGWHALTLRTRRKGLLVRTRSGYVAGQIPSHEPESTNGR